MDKVTRIAAWVFAGIQLVSLVLFAVLSTLFAGSPAFGHLSMVVPTVLLYPVILAGWIGFLMRRKWGWWLLIVSVPISLALSLTGMQIPFLGAPTIISMAELIILLMNVPSVDGHGALSATSKEPGDLRRRTRVIAWIFIAVSLYSIPSIILVLVAPHLRNPQILASLLLSAIEWPFWALLLNRRYWAWWVLVCSCSIPVCWGAWTILSPHHQTLHHHMVSPIWGILWYLVLDVLPLWALLTDRPHGHASRHSCLDPEQGRL